jgi:hypothetical protein
VVACNDRFINQRAISIGREAANRGQRIEEVLHRRKLGRFFVVEERLNGRKLLPTPVLGRGHFYEVVRGRCIDFFTRRSRHEWSRQAKLRLGRDLT